MDNMNDILIRTGSKEESQYCQKYGIEIIKLENGITIIGMSCGMDFTNWARIYWEFYEGSYGNQAGTVHFLEHFFNKKIRSQAEHNSLKISAHTSNIEIRETVSGIANPNMEDYGIWVVLYGIRQTLESPLKNIANIEKDLETERQVIKSEIQGRITNHNYHVDTNFLKTFYDPSNPFFDTPTVPGSEEEVDKIKLPDLKKVENKILIPKNLLISVYVEGDRTILKKLIMTLKQQYMEFPRGDKERHEPTLKLQSKLNPKLILGDVYKFDTKIKNGIVSNMFNWIFEYKFGSKKYFALRLLNNLLATQLLAHSRKKGWGYFTEVGIARPTDDIAILNMRIDIKNDKTIDFESGIKEIVETIKTNTKNAIEMERRRQLATPITVQDRFDWAGHGIKVYGEIIDADKIREGMLSVTSSDLDKILDEILATKPVTIVTGDLD